MEALRLALTLQLGLYAVAIIAACFSVVRFVGLQRLASRHAGDAHWWQTEAARAAVAHAVRPLWIAAAALVVGAFAPRLMGAMHG